MPSSILILHREQAHQRIHPHRDEQNFQNYFKIIFNECSEMDLVQISRQMSK